MGVRTTITRSRIRAGVLDSECAGVGLGRGEAFFPSVVRRRTHIREFVQIHCARLFLLPRRRIDQELRPVVYA